MTIQNERRAQLIAGVVAVGLVTLVALLTLSKDRQAPSPEPAPLNTASLSVIRIVNSSIGNPTGARRKMLHLYQSNELHSGADYTLAARVVASSKDRKDLLMAHDLAIAGLAHGDPMARIVVAQTEDRLFQSVGLGERYGTLGGKSLPLTDSHREFFTMLTVPKQMRPAPAPLVPVRAIG